MSLYGILYILVVFTSSLPEWLRRVLIKSKRFVCSHISHIFGIFGIIEYRFSRRDGTKEWNIR